jgi:hypothetical protein
MGVLIMSVRITNLTNRPVIFSLSSGTTLHLSPRATSSDLPDVEIKNNAKVEKLQRQFIISVDQDASPQAPEAPAENTTTRLNPQKSSRKGRS